MDASRYGIRKEVFSLDLKFATVEASMQPALRKRKHADTDFLEEHQDRDCWEVQVQKKFSTSPISLKIATLKALETLLIMVCYFVLSYGEYFADKQEIVSTVFFSIVRFFPPYQHEKDDLLFPMMAHAL